MGCHILPPGLVSKFVSGFSVKEIHRANQDFMPQMPVGGDPAATA